MTECTISPSDEQLKAGGETAVMPWLVQLLAGPLAEMKVNPGMTAGVGRGARPGYDHDKLACQNLATRAICDPVPHGAGKIMIGPDDAERVGAILVRATHAANKLVNERWGVIGRVAFALLRRKALTGDEVEALVGLHGSPGACGGEVR